MFYSKISQYIIEELGEKKKKTNKKQKKKTKRKSNSHKIH